METPLQLVREFHKTFSHPIDIPLDNDYMKLRYNLIKEEWNELNPEIWQSMQDGQLTENIAKEMADLVYVIYGLAVAFGINLDEAVKRVHESNMSKLGEDGKPIFREDGKVLKGPNYQPPSMEGVYNRRDGGVNER